MLESFDLSHTNPHLIIPGIKVQEAFEAESNTRYTQCQTLKYANQLERWAELRQ